MPNISLEKDAHSAALHSHHSSWAFGEGIEMEESPFRSAPELEARRSLHEAIGRFVVAFELVIAELR